MSNIIALSSQRAFSNPLLLKTYAMIVATACVVVIVCYAASNATPAVPALKSTIGTLAAMPIAYMSFPAGADAEPPAWLENPVSSENAP